LKRLDPVIKALYDRYSGKYSNNKNNRSMSLDEFCALMEKGNVYSAQFGAT